MLMRNLTTTAHPAFAQAVQNVATPASIKHTMGAYLPTVTYTDAKQFQHTGCNERPEPVGGRPSTTSCSRCSDGSIQFTKPTSARARAARIARHRLPHHGRVLEGRWLARTST